MEKDPVCGMNVDPTAAESIEHRGGRYHFCGSYCAERFREDPDAVLTDTTAAASEPSGKANYFCPMCPGEESDEPGDCPKCGMALEPTRVSGEERSAEFLDMFRRFWVGGLLTRSFLTGSSSRSVLAVARPLLFSLTSAPHLTVNV